MEEPPTFPTKPSASLCSVNLPLSIDFIVNDLNQPGSFPMLPAVVLDPLHSS